MTATISLDEIPGPRGLPVLGNVRDVDTDEPIESLMRLAERVRAHLQARPSPAGPG